MKRVCQSIVFFIFFVKTFLLFNQFSYPAEEILPEKARLAPWGEIKLQYDDNVFLSHNNKKEDLIITMTSGITGYLPFSDNLLKLDYHVDFIKFLDNTSQNAANHYVSGDLELNWRDVKFTIYDHFAHVFERPSIEDVSRVKRDDNRAGVVANLQMDRLGIQLGYENFKRDYKSDPVYNQYDRTDHLYSFMVTHQTFSKTKLLLEYDFNQTRYDNNIARSDSDYHQVLVGAIGDLTQKTTATIKTGYQVRNYKQENQLDFHSAVLYADIVHKFSDKNALKLVFLRTAYESTYGANNFYKVENVSGTFDHYFTPKLLGFITGLYQLNFYPKEVTVDGETKKREDQYSSLGAGLKYYLRKWLTVTLQLEHIIRNSNINSLNYDQNLATLSAKAQF